MIDYFKKQNLQIAVSDLWLVLKRENDLMLRCSVKGGGLTGQAGAIIHGFLEQFIIWTWT